MLTEAGNDLARLHPRALEVFQDGYISGHRDGYRAGYVARAADEVAEWAPVAAHIRAYVNSVHGLQARRGERRVVDTRPPAQIIADAYRSWGMEPPTMGGGRHVA